LVGEPEVTLVLAVEPEVHNEDVPGMLEAPEDVDKVTSRVLGVQTADVSEVDVDRPVVVCEAELLGGDVRLEVDDQEEDD
jgi:hypothetical protein